MSKLVPPTQSQRQDEHVRLLSLHSQLVGQFGTEAQIGEHCRGIQLSRVELIDPVTNFKHYYNEFSHAIRLWRYCKAAQRAGANEFSRFMGTEREGAWTLNTGEGDFGLS